MQFRKIFLVLTLYILQLSSHALVNGDATEILDPLHRPTRYDLLFNNELDNAIAPFTYQSSVFLLSGGYLTYLVFKDDFEERRQKNYERKYKKGGEKTWVKTGDLLGWGALPITYFAIQGLKNAFTEDTKENQKIIQSRWNKTEYVTKSVIYTALATFTMKMLISQGRPKDKLKRDSFPSGHASSSFAFSTAIWLAHGYKWGLLSTALASWISFSRIEDGSHYYHDSLFGAALGFSYAWGIYNNHFRRNLPFSFAVAPVSDGRGAQLTALYTF